MYAIQVIESIVFQILMFPHDENIMTIKQLMYYDPKGSTTLEVLGTFPLQRKALLSALGVIDPSDSRLITFDLD